MLNKLIEKDKAIYPLFAILVSILVLFCGFFFVGEDWFLLYSLGVLVLFIAFGYFKVALKVLAITLAMSVFVSLLALIGAPIEKALENGYRFSLIGLSAIITLSIAPIDLVRSLNSLKFPGHITLGLLISIRFTQLISIEYSRIKIAMKTRGVTLKNKPFSVIHRAILIPLISRILSISDVLAASLETRGYEIGAETSAYVDIRPKKRDYAFLFISLAGISIAILIKCGII